MVSLMEEGGAKEYKYPLESGKGKEIDSSLKLLEKKKIKKMISCQQHLDFRPITLTSKLVK